MPNSDIELMAEAFGIGATLRLSLQHSRVSEQRERTMAAVPQVYGLKVWVDGVHAVLLDERGFVCATEDWLQVLLLCRYESARGPGALRALLARPTIDPYAAISVLAPRFTLKPKPAERSEEQPKAPRKVLSPEQLRSIMEAI